MKEKITPFLITLLANKSIAAQYVRPIEADHMGYNDPLMEEEHEQIKGLIHKYGNRALVKISYQCAAHCRFCTRIRQIGDPTGTLSTFEMDNIAGYLLAHPEIDDVILSGGDPLYTPKSTLYFLQKIQDISSIKVIRIGTRMPFQSPESFQTKLYIPLFDLIRQMARERPFYILLHVEHPDELVAESLIAVKMLKELNVTLLSQTVFLKGINDDVDVLHAMFQQLYYLGVIPYYLYRCDNVQGLERFRGNKESEKQIAVQLRERLSGIATPLYVEDIENGYGKIPV